MPSYNLLRESALAGIKDDLASLDVVDDATTARTLTDADNGKVIRFTSATDVTVTVDGLADGFGCLLVQGGAGQVIVVAGGASTIRSYLSADRTAGQYAQASVVKLVDAGTDYLLAGETV